MGPIVTKVEDVHELLSGIETCELGEAAVLNWLMTLPLRIRIRHPDTSAIGKLEFVEM